ncbi:MAG: hypothetical protein NC099_03285 [Corallococcus sp.]|nr:hypothetical protein [Corallococcus sp.]
MVKFDETIKREYYGRVIGYGIKRGNETVVFIKTGRGGHICGENDEQRNVYVTLADKIGRKFGYSVVVSDNPIGETRDNPLDDDMCFLTDYFKRFTDFSILYAGYSAGADYGAWYGYRYPKICHMLLVNPSLNFNLHKTKECCKRFGGTVEFAIGENDPSAQWTGLIGETSRIKIKYLRGQGHRIESALFIDTVSEFIKSLPAP